MSGLGDARLTLQTNEPASSRPAPVAGESRWLLFWRRLGTRRALLRLTDAQLRDIGLTRVEANHEALRPIWTLWKPRISTRRLD
jgi:uncharacterized protein YjiS (DUF1127 family)